MDRILVKAVGIVVQGVVQVMIDLTVRAEQAEGQVQQLRRQLDERTREGEALRQAMAPPRPLDNVSRLPAAEAAEATGG